MSGVCRFYLSGYCKFGSRCRFKHEDPYSDYSNQNQYYWSDKSYSGGSYRSNGSSSHKPTNYSNDHYNNNNNNNQRSSNTNREPSDDQEYLTAVQKEVDAFVGGKQWLLTCFAPLKEKSCVPGWIDHSPEEIRWEMYKAVKDGTVEECKLRILQLYKEAQERSRDFTYQEKGMAIIKSLMQQNYNWNYTTDNPLENSNVFQNQNAAFAPSNANSTVFFQNTTGTSPNFFQQNSSDPRMNNVFGSSFSDPTQQGSPFGIAQQAASLQSNQQFCDPNPTFTFSLNQIPFNSSNDVVPAPAHQNFQIPTNFGNNPVNFNSNTAFQPSQKIDETIDNLVFSSSSDLTENEIEMFKATTFKFGKVPLKPPPRDLCDMSKFI